MLQKETQHRARSQRRIPLAGHFYFTKLLLPLLTVTAKNSPQKSVRVVNVSSIGHYVVPPDGIQWSTLSPGEDYLAMGKKIGALKLYGQSKLVRKRRLFFISAGFYLIYPVAGQHPLLERICSAIRRRRHRVHLCTSRKHQYRSRT